MKRHPVRGAYALADTSQPCRNCGADPYVWCRTPDGRHRFIPCVARIQAPPDPELDDEDDGNEHRHRVIDPSEPRRPPNDDTEGQP